MFNSCYNEVSLKKTKTTKPLSSWEIKFKKLVSKTKFKAERIFRGIKRWLKAGLAKYRGIEKMHSQNLLDAMCYNLYRNPGLMASNYKN